MTLEELAEKEGMQTQPEADREEARKITNEAEERAEKARRVQADKDSITQQLQDGASPETILYTALDCLGVLSGDEEWADEGKRELESVYADIAQLSFVQDRAATARKRLRAKSEEYADKTRRQLQRQLKEYQRLAKDYRDALDALNEITGEKLDWESTIEKDD